MIQLGKINKLKVIKQQNHGFYLEGDETYNGILLPNKHVPEGLKVNDEVEVFVYLDSDDFVIATTKKPFATVGKFASLKVSSEEEVGVFLDWGLEKDLFVPHREILYKMHPGEYYPVYIYIDSSNRIAASTRISKYIDKSPGDYAAGEKVELLPYQNTDLGVNAIINGRHSGLIFQEDIINEVTLGKKITGYIKKIREDNKYDLSLYPEGIEGREDLTDEILRRLKESGGSLKVNAKTPADTINSMFNVSRNKFKIALGHLYKKKLISIDDDGISLN